VAFGAVQSHLFFILLLVRWATKKETTASICQEEWWKDLEQFGEKEGKDD